jgi:hypothetical protein
LPLPRIEIRMNIREPDTQLSLIMFGFLLYLLSPIGFWFFLKHELESGAFPPESDAIVIPMFGFLVLWFIGLVLIPAVSIFVVLSRRIVRNFRDGERHKEE